MTKEEFNRGMDVLQAAFLRKYSEESVLVFWQELKEEPGSAFVLVCRMLAKKAQHLPSLSEILQAMPERILAKDDDEDYENLDWFGKIRFLYNKATSFTTYQERCDWVDKKQPDCVNKRQLLFHGCLLYEKIWPEVSKEHPDWNEEMKIKECLRRFPYELQNFFNSKTRKKDLRKSDFEKLQLKTYEP